MAVFYSIELALTAKDVIMNMKLQANAGILLTVMLAAAGSSAQAATTLTGQPPQMRALHGLSASQVQARFGQPDHKLDPRGGQKAQWPVIQRWVYPEATVYFEHNHVIDVVSNDHPSPPGRSSDDDAP